MLISALLILVVAAGGLALTYLIERDEPLMWRLAVGTVVGSVVYGTLAFVIGSFAGLAMASPVALVLTLAPLLIFRDKSVLDRFRHDYGRAKGKFQGGSTTKLLRFLFYAFFFLLFCFFFSQAMYETPAGIFTGGSNNLGDLPFHLGAIFSFTDGANLPPQNPSFAGAKFSYPFIADIVTAGFIKLGTDVRSSMVVQDVAWAFSLLVILERFVFRLTGDRLAARFAPWLLFFSGGLGFIWFFQGFSAQSSGFFRFLAHLPKDYTIGQDFRWGNSLITLFLTQRSLLLGMPLTIVVLQKLWEWFESEKVKEGESEKGEKGKREKGNERLSSFSTFSPFHVSTFRPFHFSPFLIGVLAGLLPLVHLHSLAALFVVTAVLFAMDHENWRTWLAFGIGVCVIAVPELAWSVTGSATRASEFVDWNFGWDKGESNVVWFWFKNTGLVIPLIALGIYLHLARRDAAAADESKYKLWLFYTPFLLLFIVANAAKLAPWQWDNIKVLIYWFVGSLPIVGLALSWIWRRGSYAAALAAVCFLSMVLAGALDVWRTASGQIKTDVFDAEAVRIAQQIRQRTPPDSLFLNAPTYNTAIVLTGRLSLMRYPGHLSSHGIEYEGREADVKTIYAGGPAADALLSKYGIDYALVSKEETGSMNVNTAYFSKFPVVAETGNAKVYKVR